MKSPLGMAHFIAPWLWWTLSLAIALTDQVLKSAIAGSLPVGTVIPLASFFNLVHFWNIGIVGGAALLILSSLLSPNAEASRARE